MTFRRLARQSLTLALAAASTWLVSASAFALPDFKGPTYSYPYILDMSQGDPFTRAYVSNQDYALPGNHDTSLDFHIFQPRFANGSAVASAPVIVYIHGANMNPRPDMMRQQILHYVRSGYTVLWPIYCNRQVACFDFDKQEGYFASTLMDMMFRIGSKPGYVRPSENAAGMREIVFVSHSMGAHIAMRAASILGHFDATWGSNGTMPVPLALILHDPAGYTFLGSTLPLEDIHLSGIRPDTLQVIIAANASTSPYSGFENAYDTAWRIHNRSPSTKKFAYVVPPQCVQSTNGVLSYTCPSTITTDSHGASYHRYASAHDNPAVDTRRTVISYGWFDQTIACVKQIDTGVAQPGCTGSTARNTGNWVENNAVVRAGTLKRIYDLTHN